MSSDYPPAGPPTPPPASPGYPAAAPMRPEDQRLWATLIHVGGIIFYFVPSLVGYLVLKDRGEFIREHTKTALNFQITVAIAFAVIGFLSLVTFGIAGILYLPAAIIVIVFSIIAAIAANKGEGYVYPKWCAIQFIK